MIAGVRDYISWIKYVTRNEHNVENKSSFYKYAKAFVTFVIFLYPVHSCFLFK